MPAGRADLMNLFILVPNEERRTCDPFGDLVAFIPTLAFCPPVKTFISSPIDNTPQCCRAHVHF